MEPNVIDSTFTISEMSHILTVHKTKFAGRSLYARTNAIQNSENFFVSFLSASESKGTYFMCESRFDIPIDG